VVAAAGADGRFARWGVEDTCNVPEVLGVAAYDLETGAGPLVAVGLAAA
jgi:hypothetical protein